MSVPQRYQEGEGSGTQKDNGEQLWMAKRGGGKAGGKRRGAKGMLMWERRLFPLEEIKAFLLLLKVIRLQVKRGLERATQKWASSFSNFKNMWAVCGLVCAPLRTRLKNLRISWIKCHENYNNCTDFGDAMIVPLMPPQGSYLLLWV